MLFILVSLGMDVWFMTRRLVFLAALQPHEEERNENGGDEGGGEHPGKDAGPHRLASRRAGPAGLDQGEDAEYEGERSHDDRPQTQAGRFERSIDDAHAFLDFLGGEFDNQNGIFRGQSDQHDEAGEQGSGCGAGGCRCKGGQGFGDAVHGPTVIAIAEQPMLYRSGSDTVAVRLPAPRLGDKR